MKNTMNGLKVDMINEKIILSKVFAKKAMHPNNPEYRAFLEAKQIFPTYTIVHGKLKENPNKKTYKGLTYEYMEKYISLHDNTGKIMKEYQEMRLIGECQPSEYHVVRNWFLETFPNIAECSIVDEQDEDIEPQISSYNVANF